ncbi:TonB-dependent receptor [Methylocystis sp. SC2]|uniref:TonB-dependent receptor n=1 Tax=Methylocystis sp. (strain SC2) TaxID=187303 RepID=UPI00027AE86A|nr:TonB-dependent receptor [Methylocystis sp. SC2]CCJ07324.1 TonB-dependent siderophore receptor [Methylocystis sp. SC2]
MSLKLTGIAGVSLLIFPSTALALSPTATLTSRPHPGFTNLVAQAVSNPAGAHEAIEWTKARLSEIDAVPITLATRAIGPQRSKGVGFDGLSLGFGAYVVGNRQGNNQGTFQLSGYVRFDAMAGYSWNSWWGTKTTAQLNIRNLTNARYFESADLFANGNPILAIYPGAPFTAIGSPPARAIFRAGSRRGS